MALTGFNENAYLQQLLSGLQSSAPEATKISVISDPHYFSPSLGTNGTAFEAYLASDRKMIAESDAILQSAIEIVKSESPDILLIPGDLTKDGEKVSHEAFASYLSGLESAGIKVYVIPGNHDVNNPHAMSYSGDKATPVETVSADEFADIYSDYGYGEALYRDTNSLSYIAAPSEKLWILAIDSCDYEKNGTDPVTAGSLSDATKTWILDKLAEAKIKGITVIGMMHHNLSEHFTLQADLFPEYVIADDTTDGTSLADELADAGLSLMFTGHFHANDINLVSGSGLHEIETGSLVTWPSPVRSVTLNGDRTIDTSTTSVTSINYDLGSASTFEAYADDFLMSGLKQLAVHYLMSTFPVSQAEADAAAPLFAAAMASHYRGDEAMDAVTDATIQAMLASGDPIKMQLAGALQSIWTDGLPADNAVDNLALPDLWADMTIEGLEQLLADSYGLTPEEHYELYGAAMGISQEASFVNASIDGLGNVVTLYFAESLDTENIPAITQFVVDNGGIQAISGLQVVNNQVILTLESPLDLSQPVKVSYNDVSSGDDLSTLQDIGGKDGSSFQEIEITNALSLNGNGSDPFTFASTLKLQYGAEISAFDPSSSRLFVTSPEDGLQVVSIDNGLNMTVLGTISSFGSNLVNSVAVSNGIVAVAVAAEDKTSPGTVYFLDADGTVGDASMVLGSITVGALPDMLTFSEDGKTLLVANEGEQDTDGNNPEGSVSIIDLSNGIGNATVKTASFGAFNDKLDALKAAGVRLFAGEQGFESVTVAQDLEPEYISFSPDGSTAFVTLQENNAIGILDIASGEFTDIVPLGKKSFYSLPLDGSDKDGIDLQTGQAVFGQFMPDAIASFTGTDGETYYVIANEGDDRDDFLSEPETARVKDLTLDTAAFPDAAVLKGDNGLGRLTVSVAPGNGGDNDNDGDIDQLLAYGARSFSILNDEGVIVFDSASHIEQFIAAGGLYTDAAGSGLFDDSRSDNKSAEPEGVTIGTVGGRTLAFVGLERGGGGVMVYDVTDPSSVSFVQYLRNSGDESPEGMLFVSAADSPTGRDFLVVSHEVSSTVSIYHNEHVPEEGEAIEDVTTAEGEKLRYVVPAYAFEDADGGDSLTYTATLADGSPLPEWLNFEASGHNQETMEDYFITNGSATDSASAITAIVTGQKTDAGNIAWATGDPAGGELTTIAETLRAEKGYAIGVASTVPFSHATPAGVVSHDVNRNNKWDIAHEILYGTQPEVVIGGGYDSYFAKAVKDASGTTHDADGNGYNDEYDAFVAGTDGTSYEFVERKAGVDGGTALADAAAEVSLAEGEKLFGLFGTSGGNFEYYELPDTPGSAPAIVRSTGDGTATVDEDPTLAEVTSATLSVLNQDEDGFFVMIEQGDIDWSNHSNYFEDMVGGIYDLDKAVTEAEEYVASGEYGIDWSNTLVIVTSDHSNSYMRIQEEMGIGDLPEQTGNTYPDGEVTYGSGEHTNELVTLSARGKGAELFEDYAGTWYEGTGIVDNTQIYQVMLEAANAGAEHIVLIIGDGMNIEHEIAASRYLYGEDFALSWQDWGELEDGWQGYVSTWDVDTYNAYAELAGKEPYVSTTAGSFDPTIGYDPEKGGAMPYPASMTFTGTPDNEDVGSIEIRVTATDATGASASQTFELTVTNAVPEVVSFCPEDGSDRVSVKQDIMLTFSEEIRAGEGTIEIHKGSVDGEIVESFNVATSDCVRISCDTLIINPSSKLDYDTRYFVTVSDGAVTDTSGAGNEAVAGYDFTTEEKFVHSGYHGKGRGSHFWTHGGNSGKDHGLFMNCDDQYLIDFGSMKSTTADSLMAEVQGASSTNDTGRNDSGHDIGVMSGISFRVVDGELDINSDASRMLVNMNKAADSEDGSLHEWFFLQECPGFENGSGVAAGMADYLAGTGVDHGTETDLVGIFRSPELFNFVAEAV